MSRMQRCAVVSSSVTFALLPLVLGMGACGGTTDDFEPTAELGMKLGATEFDVDFQDCNEYVGIGYVDAMRARALVPAEFTLQGNAVSAVVVVRVVNCASVIVDGHALGATSTSQVGISTVGPDPDAYINNYTLWFSTDQPLLKAKLTAAGVKAWNAKELELTLSGQTLGVSSTAATAPSFRVAGSLETQAVDPVFFNASWWSLAQHGLIKSHSEFPAIRFGVAHTTLTTPAGSELAALIGGTTLVFPLLDSYNSFGAAHLEVRGQASTP